MIRPRRPCYHPPARAGPALEPYTDCRMRAPIFRTGALLVVTALAAACSSASGGAGRRPAPAATATGDSIPDRVLGVRPDTTDRIMASAAAPASVPAEQARKGRDAFLASCTACHASSEFTATPFRNRWRTRRASDLYRLVSSTMPEDAPGSLAPERYLEIVTYILSMNGFESSASLEAWNASELADVSLAPIGGT